VIPVALAPDYSGVVLSSAGDDTWLRHHLASLDPPVRCRRSGRGVAISFEDAARLADDDVVGPSLDGDPDVRRAIENRRHVRTLSPRVLERVRTVEAAGSTLAEHELADSHLLPKLDRHQILNVAMLSTPDGWGGCVFDEQGTGKTLTIIATFDVLVERGEADVLLVVAPKTMVPEWKSEVRRFTGDLYKVVEVVGAGSSDPRATHSGADVIVMNYETAVARSTDLRLLARRCKVVLVVDESYNVKNPSARRTGAIVALREWCSRAYVLCGTPAPNAPNDLVAQFDIVDFGLTFSGVRLSQDKATAARQTRNAIARNGIYTRHLKRDVLPHLPGRSFTEVLVRLEDQQREAYDRALNDLIIDLRGADERDFNRHLRSFLERRQALLRICSNPSPLIPGYAETPAKLLSLDALLDDLVRGRREKIVIWSFYRASIEEISLRYRDLGIARVDGGVSDITARREAVRQFQDDDETMIFLGNPAATGAGITLHRARVAIYESFSNQAAHFMQSLDRIHRKGQQQEVEYYALLCEGTIEQSEYARLLAKTDAQGELLGDQPDDRVTREVVLHELLASRAQFERLRP
jgi:SNF2 family DNA or RNA helicase